MNYGLAKDRLEYRVTLLVVWHCVSLLVASFVAQWSCMAERNFGLMSVSFRLNRTSATCVCRLNLSICSGLLIQSAGMDEAVRDSADELRCDHA